MKKDVLARTLWFRPTLTAGASRVASRLLSAAHCACARPRLPFQTTTASTLLVLLAAACSAPPDGGPTDTVSTNSTTTAAALAGLQGPTRRPELGKVIGVPTQEQGWLAVGGSNGVATCAAHIAVGANNVPWIIGCKPAGSNLGGVFYLSWTGGGQSFGHYELIGDGTEGVNIAVNLNGIPVVTDTSGIMYFGAEGSCTSSPVYNPPSSNWTQIPGSGHVLSFAVGKVTNMFDPGVNFGWFMNDPCTLVLEESSFWGTGCGSDCNTNNPNTNWLLWERTVAWSQTGAWAQMPGQAMRVAVFSDPPDGIESPQNPWVLTDTGTVLSYTGKGWQPQSTPELIIGLTDHYALGWSGAIYQWTGTASGVNGAFSEVQTIAPPEHLTEIAYSQAIGGTLQGTIGPSDVWAIGESGMIYYLQWESVSPIF